MGPWEPWGHSPATSFTATPIAAVGSTRRSKTITMSAVNTQRAAVPSVDSAPFSLKCAVQRTSRLEMDPKGQPRTHLNGTRRWERL